MKWDNAVKAAGAAVGVLVGFFGGWSLTSRVLVVMMGIDYVLGCVCGLVGKSPKTETGHFLSRVAFAGLLKKGAMLAVILVAALLDMALSGAMNTAMGAPEAHSTMFRTTMEFFYIASEGLSIIENAGQLDAPIPGFLRRALEALRERSEDGEGEGK